MKPVLQTERLYLREFTLEDAQLLVELNSDINVTRFTADGPVDLEESKQLLKDIILPQYINKMGRWAVHLKDTHEFIGWSGIKYIESLNEYDLGYRFFKKHWGKGYATESAKAVMEYGSTILKLKQIVGRASVDNHNSIKVLEKAGLIFKETGFEHGEKIVKYALNIS
jgi:[ribosomal protein S5]-alanine N-acetyltransferase